jgi:putative transposase
MVNFCDLIETSPEVDLPPEMIGFAAERLMKLDVGAVICCTASRLKSSL